MGAPNSPIDSGVYLYKTNCENCGSSDARAIYSDGRSYCFSCGTLQSDGGGTTVRKKTASSGMSDLILNGEYKDLGARGIRADTCKKFKYRVTRVDGEPCQVADYYDVNGVEPVFQKLRFAGKEFLTRGKIAKCGLFGQQLWGGARSKPKVIVCEGEIDTLTVSQVQDNRYPVVGIPNGTDGAVKAVLRNIDFLSSYDEIIIFFDNDEAGREAAEEVAKVLPVGKAYITFTDNYKDPNEALKNNDTKAITNAIWNAKKYTGGNIIKASEVVTEYLDKPIERGLDLPFPTLTELTYGIRMHELWLLGAGTGMGKTELFKELVTWFSQELGVNVGVIFLEETPEHTVRCLVSKHVGKRLHVPDVEVTDDDKAEALKAFEKGEVYIDDHGGNSDFEVKMHKAKYMAQALDCRIILLDHVTAMAEGKEDTNVNSSMHKMFETFNQFLQQADCSIIAISHLKKKDGKAAEEGARISMDDFYGSSAIKQRSNFMFALEGDQQGDAEDRNKRKLRCLKDRYTGQATGEVVNIAYDPATGKLTEDNSVSVGGFDEDDEDDPF